MISLHLFDTGACQHGRAVMMVERRAIYRYDYHQRKDCRIIIVVPRGYMTDFATIPRFIWWLLPPTGCWRTAAVFHDYMCTIKMPRFLTDALFWHLMKEQQVPAWQRATIFYSVRLYWICWGMWSPRAQKIIGITSGGLLLALVIRILLHFLLGWAI